MIIAVSLGFIAMGGTLMVAGMGCYICLLLCLNVALKKRRIDKQNLILLGTWIAGALLNAVAPGNFVRHGGIDSTGCHPVLALRISFEKYGVHLNRLSEDMDFIGVLGIVLLLGFIYAKSKKIDNNYIITGILGLFLPVITAFPAALGYSGGVFPDRCRFMVDIAIILSWTNMIFVLGNCIRRWINGMVIVNVFYIAIVLGIILLFSTDNFKVNNNIFLKHWDALVNDIYREYYIACENFYNSLENREGEDVIIKEDDVPKKAPNIGIFEIFSDANHFANYGISQCYGLSSLIVVSEEEIIE